MSVRTLKAWIQLIDDGIPAFEIAKRPMLVNGDTFEIGDPITDEDVPVDKLRRFYKQFRIDVAS